MKRKPLKIVAGTYDANGYATATPTGFREFEPTDTFDANHIEQDATHRFVTDAKSADWDTKEPGNANIQAHVTAPHAPANAQKNSDITKAEIEAKLTGEISSHTHAGGGGGPASDLLSATTTISIGTAPAPVGGQVLKALSPTSARWDYVQNNNSSVAAQSPFATDTYLTGSTLSFLSAPVVSSTYKLLFDVTKTNVGTAAIVINIRIGTNGTIADTSRLTFTFGAGTAAADTGCFEIICTFRTAGASSVLQGVARLTSNLTVTGLSNAVKARVATSTAFDSTVANLKIGASYNGGASANHTIQLVRAELML